MWHTIVADLFVCRIRGHTCDTLLSQIFIYGGYGGAHVTHYCHISLYMEDTGAHKHIFIYGGYGGTHVTHYCHRSLYMEDTGAHMWHIIVTDLYILRIRGHTCDTPVSQIFIRCICRIRGAYMGHIIIKDLYICICRIRRHTCDTLLPQIFLHGRYMGIHETHHCCRYMHDILWRTQGHAFVADFHF